jgi:hypothetical protein
LRGAKCLVVNFASGLSWHRFVGPKASCSGPRSRFHDLLPGLAYGGPRRGLMGPIETFGLHFFLDITLATKISYVSLEWFRFLDSEHRLQEFTLFQFFYR